MSRVLSEILGAHEPAFRLGLQRLEESVGRPGHDIRLALEIEREVRAKMAALGLDPTSTTAEELYHALGEKLRRDEAAIRSALRLVDKGSPVELLQAVRNFLETETAGKKVFVIKSNVMKNVLKKLKPKATMKALGYRSQDSMFKHESALQLLVAVQLIEDEKWQQARLTAYRKLLPKDFELRDVSYEVPTTKRWPEIANRFTSQYHHNMIIAEELGGVMFLPLTRDFPAFAVLSTMLGFQAFESVRARSALLKLYQVQPNFGEVLYESAHHEPMTDFMLDGRQVSWKEVHTFYGSSYAPYHPDLFEPHIQPDDVVAHDHVGSLKKLAEVFAFWQDSHFLALLQEKTVVSLNILDVALGVCNGLRYGEHMLHHMRESLGREIAMRYMAHDRHHEKLQHALSSQLTPAFEFD